MNDDRKNPCLVFCVEDDTDVMMQIQHLYKYS